MTLARQSDVRRARVVPHNLTGVRDPVVPTSWLLPPRQPSQRLAAPATNNARQAETHNGRGVGMAWSFLSAIAVGHSSTSVGTS